MFRAAILTATQILAALILLLSGWGLGDFSAFLADPVRRLFFLLVVSLGILAVILRAEMQPIRKGLASSGWQSVELSLLLAMSLVLLWFLPFAERHRILLFHSTLSRYLGLAFCCMGGLVRLFALRRLGTQFSAFVTLQPQHRLVQDGIYGFIRHPLYLSLLLVPAGIAMVFASLLALPIAVLSVIFIADRIRKEEKLLGAAFGKQFTEYRQQTKLLIPGVL